MSAAKPIEHWVTEFASRPIPLLRESADGLAHWREREGEVDAHRIAGLALADPLMSLRVLALASRRFGERLDKPPQTVTAALVLLGVDAVFAEFDSPPVLEDRLADRPEALAGALRAFERAQAAARLAAAIAIHRQDAEVDVLYETALLHDFTGLLLWAAAPDRALAIEARQRRDPRLRTADAQAEALGTSLAPVAQKLVAMWGLPGSTQDPSEPLHWRAGQRTVALAVRIARHASRGWDDAALPDDYAELAHLMASNATAAATLVRQTLDQEPMKSKSEARDLPA
ncbi:HDOD domain-containing protein [Ramlibacter sp.]|uniref:HDOD domain-containing protein n=1 Tax=Ramlibacter sp. TaxID=1917967 RepID=UPI003D0A8968